MFKLIEPEKSLVYPPSAPCLMLLCTRKRLGSTFVTNLPRFCFATNRSAKRKFSIDLRWQVLKATRYKQICTISLYDGSTVGACPKASTKSAKCWVLVQKKCDQGVTIGPDLKRPMNVVKT